MDSKQKGIVIVAVIVVIIAAVFAAQALDDKNKDGACDGSYYFYLDMLGDIRVGGFLINCYKHNRQLLL